MKISVRNLEPTKVKLTVTVEPEELNPYLDAARKEIAKQVNVPGFRKGHVPGKIIDQRIGFAVVAGEAVNDAVPELYSKALDEKKIRPMAQPEFDVQDVPQSANDETKLKFTATVERRPDIELPEGVEMVMPGDNIKMVVTLIHPIAMDDGLRFAIREGGRTVGAGVVAKVLS